jgi:hypothetical protein
LFYQLRNISALSWREQVTFDDDDDLRFAVDQHAELLFIVLGHWSPQIQHVTSLRHIILPQTVRGSHSLLLLLNATGFVKEQHTPIV